MIPKLTNPLRVILFHAVAGALVLTSCSTQRSASLPSNIATPTSEMALKGNSRVKMVAADKINLTAPNMEEGITNSFTAPKQTANHSNQRRKISRSGKINILNVGRVAKQELASRMAMARHIDPAVGEVDQELAKSPWWFDGIALLAALTFVFGALIGQGVIQIANLGDTAGNIFMFCGLGVLAIILVIYLLKYAKAARSKYEDDYYSGS